MVCSLCPRAVSTLTEASSQQLIWFRFSTSSLGQLPRMGATPTPQWQQTGRERGGGRRRGGRGGENKRGQVTTSDCNALTTTRENDPRRAWLRAYVSAMACTTSAVKWSAKSSTDCLVDVEPARAMERRQAPRDQPGERQQRRRRRSGRQRMRHGGCQRTIMGGFFAQRHGRHREAM
jgi:hypothetical protein